MDLPPADMAIIAQESVVRDLLVSNYLHFYERGANQSPIGNAFIRKDNGIFRSNSGVPFPFMNFVFGVPEESALEETVDRVCDEYREVGLPFYWAVDQDKDPALREALASRGFISLGKFQGVYGPIDLSKVPEVNPEGFTFELVCDDETMGEYIDLLADAMEIPPKGVMRESFGEVMKELSKGDDPTLVNWVAKKDGEVVASLAIAIQGDVVGFWNGATKEEYRRHGLATALGRYAASFAVSQGCKYGVTYLMAEAMAAGICQRVGGEAYWVFDVFVPQEFLH